MLEGILPLATRVGMRYFLEYLCREGTFPLSARVTVQEDITLEYPCQERSLPSSTRIGRRHYSRVPVSGGDITLENSACQEGSLHLIACVGKGQYPSVPLSEGSMALKYRRIPIITAPVIFGFSRPKGPLLSDG